MSTPSLSLQHDEAVARRALLDVTEYDVRLDLAADDATFGSVTTVRFTSRGGATFLDLKPLRINEIRLNGDRVDPDLLDRGRLPIDTVAGENEVVVDAVMPFRNDGEGLHRSVDPADGKSYVYGMMFMDAAPSVFACFDQPDLKAPYTLHVQAPTDWVVVANAPGSNPEPGVWEFEQSQPLSTYFVTVVAGPYHVVRDEHDGIPLGLSSRASIADALDADAEELFTITKQCFDEFHRLFGIRYPFGNYHQAFVPEFNAGAMENPGCVTFRDPLVFTSRVTRGMRIQRASTVAHEMAHQWFGNIVTPRWWDDLWLNESFAEYMGNRVTADVTQYDDTWVDNAYARRQWGLYADQRRSTHPVAGNGAPDAASALQNFDGISYAKGSSVLKQLAASLGDEVFFAGAIDHFTRHRFGNATMHDLFASWERAGAGDLAAFTTNWLRTAGPDVIELDRAAGVIRRTPPAAHPADRSHTLQVARASGGEWRVETITIDAPETPYDAGDDAVVLDPYEATWAVLQPDATTVEHLARLLPDVTDEALRAGIWNNVRSGFRNGVVPAADVVDLVVASPPVESTEDTKRRLGPWLLSDVLPLAPAGSLERVHAAALAKVADLEPGSEHQLSGFRMAISTSTSPEELRGWLVGPPTGIELDLDLRWRVLVRLAALGATDPDELQQALDAEPTAVSRVEHMRARVALPTPEAKQLAWSVFTGELDVANYELEAAGLGMWQGGQEELTAPYVDRYFTDLPVLAGSRSGWVLAEATDVFFPATSLSAETLERARIAADDESLPLPMRRRLADCADDLERQLANRSAWVRRSVGGAS